MEIELDPYSQRMVYGYSFVPQTCCSTSMEDICVSRVNVVGNIEVLDISAEGAHVEFM